MTEKELVCIVCPRGCRIKITLDGERIASVEGNSCKRGEDYAKSECLCPKRTVTTTVLSRSGDVVPVRTDGAIPKEKVFECMKIINNTVIDLPVFAGDVIIKDVFGCRVVATDSRSVKK